MIFLKLPLVGAVIGFPAQNKWFNNSSAFSGILRAVPQPTEE
jgi:hypothetical protein